MPKTGERMKEDIIKDGILRLIKDSEAVALQAMDSAASVLKAGLVNAEDLSVRASDILLNTARRAVSAGSIVGHDVRDVAKSVIKGTATETRTETHIAQK